MRRFLGPVALQECKPVTDRELMFIGEKSGVEFR